MSAKTELVGYVPGPPASANQGVSDILHGSLLAYAVSSVVSIVDVIPCRFPSNPFLATENMRFPPACP